MDHLKLTKFHVSFVLFIHVTHYSFCQLPVKCRVCTFTVVWEHLGNLLLKPWNDLVHDENMKQFTQDYGDRMT
jgi:hypothetical protein